MKFAHLIKLTFFSNENEDGISTLDSINGFFPFDINVKGIAIDKTIATGLNENKITIFSVTLKKNNLIKQFLRNIFNNLRPEQKETIIKQKESRLDDNLDFFMRFDKDSWMYSKKLELTDSGKCFHLRINIAAFPKNREVALKIIDEMINSN